MEKVPIRVIVGCPKYCYREQEIEWCYSCEYFRGLEYIDSGFKKVVCTYELFKEEEE